MNVVKPKIISFNELKSIKNISKICKKSEVPIMITGGKFDDVVFMNIDYYEKNSCKNTSSDFNKRIINEC